MVNKKHLIFKNCKHTCLICANIIYKARHWQVKTFGYIYIYVSEIFYEFISNIM